MTERKAVVARMLARGYSQRVTADRAGVARSTIQLWVKDPSFMEEVERIREMIDSSQPLGVLVDALAATDPKGAADWDIRLKAAFKLIDLERTPRDDLDDDREPVWVS